jgi:hypothetical protein
MVRERTFPVYLRQENGSVSHRRHSMFIAMILLLMGGCATYKNDILNRLQTLPQHHEQLDQNWHGRSNRLTAQW